MTTSFAAAFAANWPSVTAAFGESITYTDADNKSVTASGVVVPRSDTGDLETGWEVRARQVEVHIAMSALTGITFTPRIDTISARGITYTVMESVTDNGAVYRFLCEREEVDAVRGRGRLY
jgi:hypothetical protein